MNKVYILSLFLFMGQTCWAQIRDFQTSRLNSTAGAGVASILATEGAILNPASPAFFQGSSFSYQSYKTTIKKENPERKNLNDDFPSTNNSQGFFLSDHSGPIKGGFSYLTQNENNFERERFNLHGAAPSSDRSSIGIRYSYFLDKNPPRSPSTYEVHHQVTLGSTYIIDEDTVLGLILVDPTRNNKNDERIIGGFQYDVADRFTLIGDVGTQYTKDVKKKYLWRAAVQINIFSDFFLRAGRFYDNVLSTKGTGWGASWVGPKLGVEFAQKISEHFGTNDYLYQDENLIDTSLSLLLKF